jgi:hypothetical protein
MVFVNPSTDPGRRFLVESKAEVLSLHSKKFARELVTYFEMTQNPCLGKDPKFILFSEDLVKPSEWEVFFDGMVNSNKVKEWCNWYNTKCLKEGETTLDETTVHRFALFLANSEVIVGSIVDLLQAAIENQSMSSLSINKKAKSLLKLAERRKVPVCSKSRLVMNILPITVPTCYYSAVTDARDKQEIYYNLKDVITPPFLFTKNKEILTFAEFDSDNSLCKYLNGSIKTMLTSDMQSQNPSFASQLVNIHLRRIFWNRGLFRDPVAEIYYFPMIDQTNERLTIIDQRQKQRWVVRKIIQQEDSKYKRKGDVNFFFHRGVELQTQTYWGQSFVELIPRRYYTFDGKTYSEGEKRAKIDRGFRNPAYDRSQTRLGLMRFWRYVMFDSAYKIPAEKWFIKFQFGDFVAQTVNWAPKVIGRNQASLWDYKEES